MNKAIEGRELFTLDGHGVFLTGTYHRPRHEIPGLPAGLSARSRIGLLFLNSGSFPRAATGDSAVYWADSFAAYGYPSFRLDLPALGDSDGHIPIGLLDFINAGGYATILSTKTKELVERFGLAGVIIVGHCAGAVSALYAAAASRECKGLVLMDPYFHLTQGKRTRLRQELGDWATRSSFGGLISNLYDRLKDARLLLRGGAPPGNANLPLISRWHQVASAGLPVLILKAPGLKAPGAKPRAGEFDYLRYVEELAGRKARIAVKFIEGTDHSFANRLGRAAVRQHTEHWLNAHFPLTARKETALNASYSRLSNDKDDYKNDHENNPERCLHS